jgi:hypothetical protein
MSTDSRPTHYTVNIVINEVRDDGQQRQVRDVIRVITTSGTALNAIDKAVRLLDVERYAQEKPQS